MSEFVKAVIYWRLALFKYLSGATKIGLSTFIAATASVHWDDIHGFEKFLIIAAAIVQILSFTEGFIDQTASRLTSGKPIIGTIGSGNTDVIKKDT